jgi:vacuolar-type H+-ATPase subunit B/Vma2
VSIKDESVQVPVIEKLVGDIFGGSGHSMNEDKVRVYIAHRLDHGAHLAEVLREEYVRRNCSEEEVNAIVRDSRLVHEDRVSLRRLFESGELDPTSATRPR